MEWVSLALAAAAFTLVVELKTKNKKLEEKVEELEKKLTKM